MPELPDVENFRRLLQRSGLHKRITGVSVATTKVLEDITSSELRRRLEGRRLESTRRHGKHLLAAIDDGSWLAFHFGLTGRLEHYRDPAPPPEHERVRVDFAGGEHLGYVNVRLFGRVGIAENADRYIEQKGLGPDPLELDEHSFVERLGTKRGMIKSALMDQSLLAGIGNIYSDEILYQAKIHPKTRTEALDEQALVRLYRQTRRILEMAVARGAGAEDLERRVPSTWLLPHRQKGERCERCGGRIEVARVQSRTSYFCPGCQPAPA